MPLHIARHEIFRKIIHLSSIFYPIVYHLFLSKNQMLLLTFSVCIAMLTLELLRSRVTSFNLLFNNLLKHSLRPQEKNTITGASYFVCGLFFTTLFFEKNIAITALSVLVISDTCASIVGITLGKYKVYGDKTLEGSTAFLFSAILISFILSFILNLSLISLVFASIATSIVELFSKLLKIDDNLLIPLTFAMVYNIFSELFRV